MELFHQTLELSLWLSWLLPPQQKCRDPHCCLVPAWVLCLLTPLEEDAADCDRIQSCLEPVLHPSVLQCVFELATMVFALVVIFVSKVVTQIGLVAPATGGAVRWHSKSEYTRS